MAFSFCDIVCDITPRFITSYEFLLEFTTSPPVGSSSFENRSASPKKQKDLDNHLVLVEEETLDLEGSDDKKTLALREEDSITAEFTPRVRLDHPNLIRANLTSRIKNAPKKALLVRVTGLLMFDSEHFVGHHLKRVNDWEIHPVLKLEFCETGHNCTANGNAGWKSLDHIP